MPVPLIYGIHYADFGEKSVDYYEDPNQGKERILELFWRHIEDLIRDNEIGECDSFGVSDINPNWKDVKQEGNLKYGNLTISYRRSYCSSSKDGTVRIIFLS